MDRDTLIHLLAGGVGGTTGAIFTCPLEVVKTRLQSSNSGFDTPLKVPDIASDEPGKTTCKTAKSRPVRVAQLARPALGSQHTVIISLLNGNRGNFGSSTPILYSTHSQPLRPLKSKLISFNDRTRARAAHHMVHIATRVHTSTRGTATVPIQPGGNTRLGVMACLRHIVENEGVRGLFRGLGPNLVGVAPARAIYFWSYSTTKRSLNLSLPKPNRDTPFVHVVSAANAGFISSCVTNPIWLVKTRLQLDRSSGGNIRTVIASIYQEGGVTGLWKGVTASWWGISETMIHFVVYEFLKKKLAETQNKQKHSDKTAWDFAGFMVCGATSKTCATCVAYPHEVARTRMRESGSKYRSFWQTLRRVGREEGRRGLYRGLATQLIRQIPNTAIMMATYELTVYLLTRYLRDREMRAGANLC